ncbi:MAG: DeoR/GlpR transcriptional regulator [Fidelibacterota bacterium]|nr:MAG: DeoR/GlpR transcriptional regulator [Candidatus Neomarinimicrobiota bacterium]
MNNSVHNTVDRRNEIIRLIQENGKVRVEDLSALFNVSTVTIRNDLNYLERKGLADRIYGGALARVAVAYDSALIEKAKLHVEEKRRIGGKSAEMIFNGDSIILDSGTTTIEIAKRIKGLKNLTVMTNAVNIATELAGNPDISVMLTGGILRENSFSLVGPQAEATLQEFYFDKVFLGIDGFDLATGLTTPNHLEAHLNAMMIKVSKETIIVTDSSKFGRKRLSRISGPENISRIITDSGISREYLDYFESLDIEIILV